MKAWLSTKFPRTTIMMVGLTAFLAGLGLARSNFAMPLALACLSLGLVLLTVRLKSPLTVLAVAAFGLCAGWWRGSIFLAQMEPFRELSGQPVVFIGRVHSDAVYGYQGQLSFDLGQIEFIEPVNRQTPGLISVRGYGEPAVYRGDILRVEARLLTSRGSRQARTSFAQFKVLERSAAPVEKVRRDFVAGMETALPEPSASFALGLVLGYRTTLPEDTSQALRITGLTHVIAASGYNLTVIVRAVRRSLGRLSKFQQISITVALIVLFLLVSDFSASIVRASIVSGLSLMAWYYGRQFRPLLLLLLSGVITAAWNPLYIWSDIGWHLSFLAFFGVLIVAPLLAAKLSPSKKPSGLTMILLETTAAQAMTAPLILYIFNQASLVGILSNVIIGPLVPLVMLLSLPAGLTGMLAPPLAAAVALPASLLLSYILDLVNLMAGIPNALIERSISLAQMLVMYGLILVATTVLWRQAGPKDGKLTDSHLV